MDNKFAIQIKNPNNNEWYFVINQTSIGHSMVVVNENEPPLTGNTELTRMNLNNSREEAINSVASWINQKESIRYEMQQSAPWINSLEELIVRVVKIYFEAEDEIDYMIIADKTYSI